MPHVRAGRDQSEEGRFARATMAYHEKLAPVPGRFTTALRNQSAASRFGHACPSARRQGDRARASEQDAKL